MKFDTMLMAPGIRQMPPMIRAIEDMGFDGVWTSEVNHDAFLPLVLAAEHSERIDIGTAIAVAFPRSPTVLAHIAWDLAQYSNGRFWLGLGSQVKAHNERRFGVPWSKPVRKMRETIEAMHAIWDCWQDGKRLAYKGEFFDLNLMPPFFRAPRLSVPRPRILISAVNKLMLKLAGKVCDGVHIHPLHTTTYLREFAWPHMRDGMRQTGRSRDNFYATTSVFVIPTDSEKSTSHYEGFVRQQIAFYMSTPAYRGLADMHGWTDIAEQLSVHARQNEWVQMGRLISDEILNEVAVTGTFAALPGLIQERYGDMLDRVSYYTPFVPGQDHEGWKATIEGFHTPAAQDASV